MIRKAIIIVLSLGTALTGITAVVSLWRPLYWESVSASRLTCTCICFYRLSGALVKETATDPDTDPAFIKQKVGLHRWVLKAGNLHGFNFHWRQQKQTFSSTTTINSYRTWISVPLWAPILLFGIYPTIAFIRGPLRRYRRYRRRKRGSCIHCGYDLTGNVTGVCPECGEGI